MAQRRDVKEPYAVDFTASPVKLADAAKDFNVPNQGSLSLIFGGLDQHGPIVARDPIPASQRRFTQSNHVENEHSSWRQGLSDALKKLTDETVGITTLGVVGQRFTQGDNRVEALDGDVVDGGVNEVRRGNNGAGKFQQVGRGVDAGYIKSRSDERFRQRPGAAACVQHSPNPCTGRLQTANNLAGRAPGQRFKRGSVNIRQIALVERWHPFDCGGSARDLQFGMMEACSLTVV